MSETEHHNNRLCLAMHFPKQTSTLILRSNKYQNAKTRSQNRMFSTVDKDSTHIPLKAVRDNASRADV